VKLLNFRTDQSGKKSIAECGVKRTIGLSRPGNMFDYEFQICGNNVPYIQNEVLNVFVQHGAMLVSLEGSANAFEDNFTLTVCCNLERADSSPRELLTQLQGMKYVAAAEYSEIRGRLFGRRLAGFTFNNRQTAVALPSDLMINLGQRLARETGSTGTAALFEEGREYANYLVRELGEILEYDRKFGSFYTYEDQPDDASFGAEREEEAYCMKCRAMRPVANSRQIIMSNGSHALQGTCRICSTTVFKIGSKVYGKIRCSPLVENAQACLLSGGWGAFELRSAIDGRLGEVTISDPPTLSGGISYGNQFLDGIAAGLLEAASGNGNEMMLVGQKYDQKNRMLTLHFAERVEVKNTRTKPAAKANGRTLRELPAETAGYAVNEVDKIIRSLEKIESDAIRSSDEEPVENKDEEGPIII
jgi:hypothetical protein